jgi:hypothetical protein
MRLLRGHRKEAQREHAQNSMQHVGASQTDVDRYRSAFPAPKDRNLETPDIAVRPSTSGGPGDRRTLFHVKTNPDPSIHSRKDLPFSLPSSSSTILYTAEVTNSSEGIIGIALGSPSLGSHWTFTPQAATFDTGSRNADNMSVFTQPDSPSSFPASQQPPKSKLGRWKSMFRKAAPQPPAPDKPSFYQLAQSVTATRAMRADSHQDDDSIKSNAEPVNDRTSGGTPSPPAFKTNIRASRAFTTPRSAPERPRSRARAFTAGSLPANPRVSVIRSATNPLPPSNFANASPAVPKLLVSKSAHAVPTLSGNKPLLDVSIPDIKLDRYSVMFGNLLQPTSDRSSSLLVRRQGNAEKLKPLNKLSVKVRTSKVNDCAYVLTCEQDDVKESPIDYRLQRRATSPIMPSPSPRLSLFPSTGNSRAPSPRSGSVALPKGLHRSKTERSPLRQTFSRAESDWNKAQELFVKKPITIPNLKPQASMNLKVQQLSMTPTSIHSFESDTDSITIVVAHTSSGQPQKLHLDDREPDWEICAKPPTVARSHTTPTPTLVRADSRNQPTITKLSALSSHPSSAPLEAPSPLQRIQQLQSPPLSARQTEKRTTSETRGDGAPKAMVGVARSVSVSRANSPRTLVRTASELRSPGDRLVERQALTPTMVEVKNRRSQRVQLVDA